MEFSLSERSKKVKFSPIREIFDLASRTPNLTRLEVGQPDFPTPSHIRISTKKTIDEGFIGYSPTNGLQETRKAVSDRLKEDYGIEYDFNKEIVITIGASGSLYLALRALTNPGDEILIPDPGFATYAEIIKDSDGIPVRYPLIPDDNFSIDIKKMESLITNKTKAIILNSPGNPAGNVISKCQLESITSIAEKNNIIILSDEAYDKIIFGKKHIPTASVAKNKYNVLTIGSASKAYAMCGYRIGFAAGHPKLIAEIVKWQSLSAICPSYLAQKSYAEALHSSQESTELMRDEYRKRRDYFVEQLNEILGIKCNLPDGAFYAFADISEINNDDWKFTHNMIENVKVTCIPGSSFGDVGKGFVRFSFATSTDVLKEGIKKMKAYF